LYRVLFMALWLTAAANLVAVLVLAWQPQVGQNTVYAASAAFVGGFMAHYAWSDAGRS